MKVKRTCRNCGTVWHDKKGIFGDLTFVGIFFNVLYSTITKGSAIDTEYMNDRDRKIRRSCPNCGSANVAESKITEQEEAKVTHIKELNAPAEPPKSMTPKEKKVGLGCLIIIIVIIILVIIGECIDEKTMIKTKRENDNASFERARVLLQSSEEQTFVVYENTLKELNSISSSHEKYNEAQILKRKADSLLSRSKYGSLAYKGQNYKTVKIGNQTWMAENLNYDVKGSKCYEDKQENCKKYGRLYYWATAMGIDEKYNKNYWEKSSKIQGVCPSGWHIPNSMEWETLVKFADHSYSLKDNFNNIAGKKLKAKSGWTDAKHEYCNLTGKAKETYAEKRNYENIPDFCNGTDNYGFSLLPVWAGTIMGGNSKLDNAKKEPKYSYGASYWSSTEKIKSRCYNPTQAMTWGVSTNGDYAYDLCLGKINLKPIRCVKD